MFLRVLRTELKRAVGSWTFAAAVGLCLAVFLSEIWDDLTGPLNNQATIFYISLTLGGFILVAPIIAAIPSAFGFCDDRNSGYYRLLAVRQSYSTYIAGKCLGAALSGGLALGLGVALHSFFLFLYFPLFDPEITSAATALGLSKPWEYLGSVRGAWPLILVQVVICILFGMVWATMGLMFSAVMPNRYVAIAIPFVLYLTCFLVLSRMGLDTLSPAEYLVPYHREDMTLTGVILYEIVSWAVVSAIFCKLAKRRIQDA